MAQQDIDRPGHIPENGPAPKWNWGERPPQVFCLLGAIVLIPPIILFSSTQMAALLLLVGSLLLVTNPVSGLGPLRTQPYLIPIVAVLAVGAISGLWSIDESATAKRFWKIVGFTAFGVLALTHARELRKKDRELLGSGLIGAFWVLLILFAFERFSENALTQLLTNHTAAERYAILNRPGSILLLISWPAAGFLFSREKVGHAILVLALAGIIQIGGQGQTVLVAWLAGLIAAAFGAVMPRVWSIVSAVLIGVGILISPVLVTQNDLQQKIARSLPETAKSLRHRILIWDFTSERIGEKPITGWGLATSRNVPGAEATALSYAQEKGVTWLRGGDSGILGRIAILPLHPHNAILQIWLELGLIGALCVIGFFWYCARSCRDGPPGVRACRFGLMVSALTIACVSYGVWQSWWVASLFLISAFSAAIPDKVQRR